MPRQIERLLALQELNDAAWWRAYRADDFDEYVRILVRIRAVSRALATITSTPR